MAATQRKGDRFDGPEEALYAFQMKQTNERQKAKLRVNVVATTYQFAKQKCRPTADSVFYNSMRWTVDAAGIAVVCATSATSARPHAYVNNAFQWLSMS